MAILHSILILFASSWLIYHEGFAAKLNASEENSLREQSVAQQEERFLENKMYICHSVSPAIAKMVSRYPEFVMGSYHLFQWDTKKGCITLSNSFQSLLQLLNELEVLKTVDLHDLNDLNALLQHPQGSGGLLRKPESERWEMVDSPLWQTRKSDLINLLSQLGFIQPRISITWPLSVTYCAIFGARAETIETRIRETLQFFLRGDLTAERIFLLGSKRKLIPKEKDFLVGKIEALSNEEQKGYWQAILGSDDHANEVNACVLLWECLLPEKLKQELEGKVHFIHSTRLGFSYREREGHRTTTDVTTDDFNAHYQDGEEQSIFALVEQPYGRLIDQLRASILTNAKQAAFDSIQQRMHQITFYFIQPQLYREFSIGIILDEIARNVYRTVDLLRYLEQTQPPI